MNLLPTPDQEEILASAAAVLAAELPITRVRELAAGRSVVDPKVWRTCAELGWFGLGLPEDQGGIGLGATDETLLFREIGRSLAPGPFLATTLGARVASGAGRADLVVAILAGELVVGLAEPHGDADVGDRVTGPFDLIDTLDADFVVAVGRAGAALLAIDDLGPVTTLTCIDEATRLAEVTLSDAPAAAWVPAADDPVALRGSLLAAASLVGMAEATRDRSAEHARTRVQFGKPIGVNQAIKHRCADMALRADAALAQVSFAAACFDAGRADTEFQVVSAKVVAGAAARANADGTVQVHGGMGYTYEHDAHLFVKRVHVLDRLLGDRRSHLARLIDLPPAQ